MGGKEAGRQPPDSLTMKTITSPRASSTPRLRPQRHPHGPASIRPPWGKLAASCASHSDGAIGGAVRPTRRPHNDQPEAAGLVLPRRADHFLEVVAGCRVEMTTRFGNIASAGQSAAPPFVGRAGDAVPAPSPRPRPLRHLRFLNYGR